MILIVLNLTQDIEQENAHILMQIFMIQEQLRQKSQVFTVDWVFIAVDFKNSHTVLLITIDLIPWRMEQRTGFAVPFELDLKREETQAEIADIEAV